MRFDVQLEDADSGSHPAAAEECVTECVGIGFTLDHAAEALRVQRAVLLGGSVDPIRVDRLRQQGRQPVWIPCAELRQEARHYRQDAEPERCDERHQTNRQREPLFFAIHGVSIRWHRQIVPARPIICRVPESQPPGERRSTRNSDSKSRDPLHDGHRPGLTRRSPAKTKPQSLQRAGTISIWWPAAVADRMACCKSSSMSLRRRPSSRAIEDTDRGSCDSRSIKCRRNTTAAFCNTRLPLS
jgi:hypothetical protein